MKKRLIMICLGVLLLMSTSIHAACTEGIEITGKNGHVYCVGKISMNWYAAFAWCNAQGRSLATMEQLCNIDENITQQWDGNMGSGNCPNLVGVSSLDAWLHSATPRGPEQDFYVNPTTGNVSSYFRVNSHLNPRPACW